MRIIPAIDIIDGKCVRLTKGDYSTTKIYNENSDITRAASIILALKKIRKEKEMKKFIQ